MSALSIALVTTLQLVCDIIFYVILASCVASFIPAHVLPPALRPIVDGLYRVTEPVYAFIRRFVPTSVGSFDFAPVLLLLALHFINTLVRNLLLGH